MVVVISPPAVVAAASLVSVAPIADVTVGPASPPHETTARITADVSRVLSRTFPS
jgi:hypothetical protein